MSRTAKLLELGRRPYREALVLQREIHARVAAGDAPDTWIFVEHDPVVTLGRNAKRDNLKLDEAALLARGVDVVPIERGGDVTYHGPGQLVVYPIMRLERFREVVPLVRKLEAMVINACATFGVSAERWSEHAGIWVAENQICAVGLAIQKMASLHGIALNVSTALDYDQLITPCGLPDRGITSLEQETGTAVAISEAAAAIRQSIETTFDLTLA